MRCYNHQDVDAVGTCKSCGRALCPSCAAEVEKAVACRDRCETDVATLQSINRNALQYARTTKQSRYLGAVMLVAVGAVFATMGLTYNDIDVAMYAGLAIV